MGYIDVKDQIEFQESCLPELCMMVQYNHKGGYPSKENLEHQIAFIKETIASLKRLQELEDKMLRSTIALVDKENRIHRAVHECKDEMENTGEGRFNEGSKSMAKYILRVLEDVK